jgi:homeobox protein cut-like
MAMEPTGGTFTLQDANQILEYWRDFDLEGRRISLDKQCMEMREMKTTSMNGRKHLNELTKTFRSKAREEQLGMVTEVLKSYQEEIDALSRRAKYSESAFYALYKAIFEAPDPCTALDGLVGMIASSSTNQLEIERLRAELLQYDEEFQQLKNQDITIRPIKRVPRQDRGQGQGGGGSARTGN